MPFQALHERFPEIAERETRTVTVLDRDPLPRNSYLLVESYCNDEQCDCRRVFINVFAAGGKEALAVIGYGWEERKFYQDWMHGAADEEDLREMQGPALVRMAPQCEMAAGLLDMFRQVLVDKEYVERLKRHYRMFRDAVDKEWASKPRRARGSDSEGVSRNAPCPCGSGKKYKRCCAR